MVRLRAISVLLVLETVMASGQTPVGEASAQPTGPGQSEAQVTTQPSSRPAVSEPSANMPSVATTPYGEISGLVKSGNTPLPGVVVSAANTLTGKKYSTSTDLDGSFKISVSGKGRYVVRAEFSAFAPVTQEVLINDQNRSGKADLAMVLLSR